MYYSVVGGHPSTDTNVIPEQLLQTVYLLSANICVSSPQFDGKFRTSAPFSTFLLILHSSLMFFFPHIDHLFPMFSRMLKFGVRYRRGWWQTKKNCNILNLLLQANVSPMFHIWTFPHSNSSRLTCRCSPSHLFVVAVEKCLTTNTTCSVSEKWVLDSTVTTSGRRITPCRRHPTFLSL